MGEREEWDRLVDLARAGRDGRHWYVDAWRAIQDLTPAGWTPKDFAAVVALTSPRVHVKRNIKLALEFAEAGQINSGHLPTVAASLARWVRVGEIGGPKVGAFYKALTGDHSAVVLDVWMGKAFAIDQNSARFRRVHVQRDMTRRVKDVACVMGWTPRQAQAAIWYGAMREAGRKPKLFSEYAKEVIL